MTLSELLDELNGIDPETRDAIVCGIPLKPFCQYFTFDRCGQRAHQYQDVYLPFSQMEKDVALLWLQGCVQRACERRGWFVIQTQTNGHSAKISNFDGGPITKVGDSPAEALLAAYIAAVKKEAKR